MQNIPYIGGRHIGADVVFIAIKLKTRVILSLHSRRKKRHLNQ